MGLTGNVKECQFGEGLWRATERDIMEGDSFKIERDTIGEKVTRGE